MHLGCHSDLSLNSKHALIIQYNGIWFVPIEIQRCNLNEIAQFAAPHLLGLGHQDAVCLVDFSEPIPVNLGNLFTRNFAALPSRAHFDLQSQHGRYEFAHARFAGQKVETKQKGDTKRGHKKGHPLSVFGGQNLPTDPIEFKYCKLNKSR